MLLFTVTFPKYTRVMVRVSLTVESNSRWYTLNA